MVDQDTSKEEPPSDAGWEIEVKCDEAKRVVWWWDATLNASLWLGSPAVGPADAAALLCCHDPSEGMAAVETSTADGIGPQEFRLLRARFEAEAKVDPKPWKLLDWHALAKAGGLRYHKWLEEYLDARSKLGLDASDAAGREVLTHNLSAPDQAEAEVSLAAGKTYWRQVLQIHIARIDAAAYGGRATARQAIAYLKRLGDRRLLSGGTVDMLMWLTDQNTKKLVKKHTVANALADARKRPLPPGSIPP